MPGEFVDEETDKMEMSNRISGTSSVLSSSRNSKCSSSSSDNDDAAPVQRRSKGLSCPSLSSLGTGMTSLGTGLTYLGTGDKLKPPRSPSMASDSGRSTPRSRSTPREFKRAPPRSISAFADNLVHARVTSSTKDLNAFRNQGPNLDDSLYGIESSLGMTEQERSNRLRHNLTVIYSCIYAIFLAVMGGIIYVNHQSKEHKHVSEIFSICISLVGISWLLFFHVDLFIYKRKILRRLLGTSLQVDNISTCTDFNFAISFLGNESPPYRFLTGRHSGSFYLKAGLAAFCFGHLINEGLQLAQQVLNYIHEERRAQGCGELSSVTIHTLKPLYSFYQLFMVFKYSNVIIYRYKELARFGVMHIMATCICFWFGTIVEDALEDYQHKLAKMNEGKNNTDEFSCYHMPNSTECLCVSSEILSFNNIQAIPYLYPFTIEFNLLLAGVWFIVWHNIGQDHQKANPHHFNHKIDRTDGIEEVIYQSNLVISADCHASNKGLFAGLFLLMASIISIIVFFVAMSSKEYHKLGVSIHYFQEGTLTCLTLGGVILAYKQLSKLDFNFHPITFLDDVLLFIPLPFFFVQSLLTIMSEYHNQSLLRSIMWVLVPIQVLLQTPFIIDGLRRCSNTQALRYKKPGREIVTFLIVCNLTMWIINTFEAKSVESQYGQKAYFGEFLWMFISHTTLPLMLFYRFHSSVCLADIWKSAYEKGE